MSAALVSAIRDLSGMCKALQSPGSSDFQQQVLALERQINSQLGHYKIPSMINISATARIPTKHHPLTHSNSVAVPTTPTKSNSSGHREHRKLDRSVSEPVERLSQQPRPVQTNSSRYKTELCRPFEESGTCKYGDKCQFAHGINELRTLARHPKYKTELCRTFHTTGFCPYGPRCHFIHNDLAKSLVVNNLPSGGITIPATVAPAGTSPPLQPSNDFDIGSFSLGSAGELSPNSSVSSGSPNSSNGFYMDEPASAFSPVPPMPQTAPPFISNAGFFDQDFVPFPNAMPNAPQTQDVLPRQAFSSGSNVTNSTVDVLSASLDNLNLTDVSSGPVFDVNRNIRLPIFSRLSFTGLD